MIWEVDEQKATIEGLDAQGRPDPAYAAALGLLRAPFGRRALAAAIDVAVWAILMLPLWIGATPLLLKLATGVISAYGFLNHPDFVLAVVLASVSTLLGLVYLVVQLVLHGTKGMTVGKAMAGIRTVDVRTLERPGVGRVLLRFLILVAAGIVPVVGPAFVLASPVFDPEGRGRGLHDKATNIWLVDVRRGLNPYAEKRMRIARKLVKSEPTLVRSTLPSLATPIEPGAQPEYRPGSRVSAGVLGVARPYESHERPSVGLSLATPAAPQPTGAPGRPVLGGYRDGPPAAAAPAPAASAPAVQPASAEQPAPGPPAPAPPAPAAQPAPPAPAPGFALRFDSGDSVSIACPVLLGRHPDAAEHPGAIAAALADESKSLSKTHLLARPVEGGVEIIDWRSTNGSGLIRGGVEYAVPSDAPTVAIEGDRIRLGDLLATVIRT